MPPSTAPAPSGKLVHPARVTDWAHRQKMILRTTYDEAWNQGLDNYLAEYPLDASADDFTDPVTADDTGDDIGGPPPDTSQQPAPQQQNSWLHQQVVNQITPGGRVKDKFTPVGRAEERLISIVRDLLIPDDVARATALHPALAGINNMAGNMLALQKTGSAEGDQQALLDYIDQNSWRVGAGESVAWAGEQNGYAEVAAADNKLLEWQTADDDRVCPDCEALGQFPPQPRSDWPSQPGDGSTQCNVGCRCSFEVSPIEVQPGDIYTPELSAAQHDLVNQLLDKQAQTLADSAMEAAYLDGTTMQESSAASWVLREYDDSEPRDDHGRWTDGGGSSGGDVAALVKSLEAGNHTEVSAADAPKVIAGLGSSSAPVELENLHVDGVGHGNLFDKSATSLDRAQMPQVPGDAAHMAQFQQLLAERGLTYTVDQVSPLDLHATQDQLDGRTVGKIVANYDPSRAGLLVTADDGAILDGHHRWASGAVFALEKPGYQVSELRVHTDINTLLKVSYEFDRRTGTKAEAFGQMHEAERGPYTRKPGDPKTPSPGPQRDPAGGKPFKVEQPTEPPPDPSKPYIWLDGKWWLLASDRQDAPLREAERPMREYSDDEPRDYHGRWTGGGDSTTAENTAALQTEPGMAPTAEGQWSSADVQQAQQALSAAVSRWPELSNGPRPYAGIGYTSSATPPPGISQSQWDQLRAQTLQSGADGTTAGLLAGDRTYTAINDSKAFVVGTRGETMPSDNTPYGTAMHEIGHAWAAANGLTTAPATGAALMAAGITPRDIQSAGSVYGASDAREGFAELFSQSYTPGYSLPGDLAGRFDRLIQAAEGGGFAQASYGGGRVPMGLVKEVGPLTPHIKASAERNLRANAWVSYVPELMRESVGRLREYDDSESRDGHGRWTAGGGDGSTLTAHPGDQAVQDLAARAFASPALSTAQVTAIASYETGNYTVMNDQLRSGSGSPDTTQITAAISGSHTTEPTTVYRGLGDPGALGYAQAGDQITDHGIISTSLSGYEAGMFTGYGGSFADANVLAEIHLPTGTPALALSTAMPHNTGSEAEVLLAPGSTFNVDVVRSDADVASGQPRYVLSYAR